MATKQATHVRPTDVASIQILAGDNGGFMVLTNCGSAFNGRSDPNGYFPNSGAAFSTAEEAGAWVLGVLQNITHKKFGPQSTRAQ